jgi:clan AA aspartic protease (TIGR02281 family)
LACVGSILASKSNQSANQPFYVTAMTRQTVVALLAACAVALTTPAHASETATNCTLSSANLYYTFTPDGTGNGFRQTTVDTAVYVNSDHLHWPRVGHWSITSKGRVLYLAYDPDPRWTFGSDNDGLATLWHENQRVAMGTCDRFELDPPAVATGSRAPLPQTRRPQDAADAVPIYLDDGGRSVWVDVQLGSLSQRMLIDTGATSISIQKSVANDLLRRGEASLDDPGQVMIADGSTHAVSLIQIDTVRLGNKVLHEVIAGVSPEQASPLLGFPVLNQAGRFTIDTKNRQLIFD